MLSDKGNWNGIRVFCVGLSFVLGEDPFNISSSTWMAFSKIKERRRDFYARKSSFGIVKEIEGLPWWRCHWLQTVSHHCLSSNHGQGMCESCQRLGVSRCFSPGTGFPPRITTDSSQLSRDMEEKGTKNEKKRNQRNYRKAATLLSKKNLHLKL